MGNPSGPTLSNGYVAGDFIISEAAPPIVTREPVTGITNASTSAALDLPPGYPMNGSTPVVAGQESTTTGLLIARVYIPAAPNNNGGKGTILARGPAAVNRDALPTVDKAGSSFNMSTLATRLAALGIVVRRAPASTETTTQSA